ncbi:MAG: hypothetical protein FWC92_08075 [Defluviitaleaceae bacterium]|nr:hypothetical protein [Defluviitaleaceae bacterium]
MKKLIATVIPLKLIAGGILFGLIGFYMVVGTLYARLTSADFEYSVPFAFIIQGAVLAIAIAVLWEVFFGENVITKWRFFRRAIAFNFALIVLVAICYLTSFALPTGWEHLWLIGTAVITLGIAVMSGLNEIYYRKTGARYNEMLRIYKQKHDQAKPL